uniref:Uncharacterized protein n=1 Tax=Setaria italica TaxID=4555 RepID=K3ZBK2_SETIT
MVPRCGSESQGTSASMGHWAVSLSDSSFVRACGSCYLRLWIHSDYCSFLWMDAGWVDATAATVPGR